MFMCKCEYNAIKGYASSRSYANTDHMSPG